MNTPKVVLVADYDQSTSAFFTDALLDQGYEVTTVDQFAMPVIAEQPPHLILLNLSFDEPTYTLALLNVLNHSAATRSIPVVVSTTEQRLLNKHKAPIEQLGYATMLLPCDLEQLYATVAEHIGQ